MRKITYLLQVVYSDILNCYILHELATSVHEQLALNKWLDPSNTPSVRTATLEDIQNAARKDRERAELRECVPVGSIEFVEAVLQAAHGIRGIKPINIPSTLRTEEYTARRLAYASGKEALVQLCDEWDVDSLFIKSNTKLKADYTGIYSKKRLPDISDIMFCSEVIPIDKLSSEWRVFVLNGVLQDIRCYTGEPFVVPDKDIVTSMIASIGASLPSYTLDLAVTGEGRTVVIEVHNFISCGLYGATPPLKMYVSAYMDELKRGRTTTCFLNSGV